jgi:8-oxo-dGTP pyrophosphatase MutT (NUDIX family)
MTHQPDPSKGPAAVVLVTRGPLVLALTRKRAWHDWHLPGGKVEAWESAAEAAARELAEETGLRVRPRELRHVCEFVAHTGRPVQAYTLEAPSHAPDAFGATPAGQPAWVPPGMLTQPWCTFREEAARVLGAVWLGQAETIAAWGVPLLASDVAAWAGKDGGT